MRVEDIKRICIDPGHGGKDPGAVDHGICEEDFNLIIGSMVAAQLRQLMFSVVQTRAFDQHLDEVKSKDLQARCDMANVNKCDLFVSIHANAAEQDTAAGFEVFYSSDAGRLAAEAVLNSFKRFFPTHKIRGTKKTGGLYVLNKTDMPAILIEGGFITNPAEAEFLKDAKQQVTFASSISQGIYQFFNNKKGE